MQSSYEREEDGRHIKTAKNLGKSEAKNSEVKISEDIVSSNENDPDIQCGLGSWTPRWLQVAASPKLFFFFYTVAGFTQGALYTYVVGCISTLEKRFAYDTRKTALILISDEIGPIIFGALLGYFGGRAHRPRIITYGMLIGSFSAFVMTLPYFIYGASRFDVNLQKSASKISGVNAQFCDKDFNDLKETCSASIAIPAVLIFMAGNFLAGVSSTIFYSIGTSYLDDTIKKNDSPVYLGAHIAIRFFGPSFGFLLSSFCLQCYEDPFYDPGYGPSDPRWVGAWWLGFIILGILIFIFSAPIMLFPKRFPKNKIPPPSQKTEEEAKKSPIEQLKDMGKAVKRLSKNPILVTHYLGAVFRLIGIMGYYTLLPKYMEMQFRQSASKANLYTGPLSILGIQIGTLLGGFCIRRFKPRPRVLTGSIAFIEIFTVKVLLACMFITCPFHQMQENPTYNNPLFQPENECNAECMCTTKAYTPVCGPDGKTTYFSPCYAGCSSYNKTAENEVFSNCKCVHNEKGEFMIGEANKSYCGVECQWMITYIVILTFGKFLASSTRVASLLISLRCVDPEDKSITLGAGSGILSLLAFIPYPIIYGALTDACCLVWEESCGTTGNCWVYDVNKFRYILHGVSAGFVVLGCVADIINWYLSPRLRNFYDEDEDEKTEEPIANTELTNYGRL